MNERDRETVAKAKKKGAATAALALLQQTGTAFEVREYEHVNGETNFGLEAAEKLGRSPEQVFKTLMITHEKDFAVCVVPVGGKLNVKAAAAALGCPRCGGEAHRVCGGRYFSPGAEDGSPYPGGRNCPAF